MIQTSTRYASGGTISGTRVYRAPAGSEFYIDRDIRYNSGTQSDGNLPQVIIIADKINIDESVTNVDAWLVADDAINTCYTASNTARDWRQADRCDKPLRINGPVVADTIHMRRTAGSQSESTLGDAAETFNLRPDAYLWAMNRAGASKSISTSYIQELPPRY